MSFPIQPRTIAQVDARWNSQTTPVLLEALFSQGHTYKRLAELLGAPSDKAVFARAKEMGLPEKYPRGGSAVAARKATIAARKAEAVRTVGGWPKAKTCLKCRETFRSEGPHNHVCPPCQRSNSSALDDRIAW